METSEGAAILESPEGEVVDSSGLILVGRVIDSSGPIPVSPSPDSDQCLLDKTFQVLHCSERSPLYVLHGFPVDTMRIDTKDFDIGCHVVRSTTSPASHFHFSPSHSSLQLTLRPSLNSQPGLGCIPSTRAGHISRPVVSFPDTVLNPVSNPGLHCSQCSTFDSPPSHLIKTMNIIEACSPIAEECPSSLEDYCNIVCIDPSTTKYCQAQSQAVFSLHEFI